MADNSELVTMEEAIKRLSTSRGTFYRWLRAGRISGFKIGRQWRFEVSEIERFLKGQEPSIDLPVSPDTLIETLQAKVADSTITDNLTDDAPIKQVVNLMLIVVMKKGAALLFIDALEQPLGEYEGVFSLRIDGLVHHVTNYDLRLHQPIIDRLKQMCDMDVTQKRVPQDGRMRMKISPTKAIDFVVSTMPALSGESCAARIIDPAAATMGFDALGMLDENRARTDAALARKQGLYISGGPAESGKQVTAYTLLNALNNEQARVVTIEDPVAINLPGVVQSVPNPSLGLGINELIRACTKQNVDVLYVSHMEDAVTLTLAMQNALSRKVITTMHLRDATTGLIKIKDQGAKGLLQTDTVALISAQRLVRRLCKNCRVEETPDDDAGAFIERVSKLNGVPEAEGVFYAPQGCDKCHGGYLGRIGLFETLIPTPAIENALSADAPFETLQQLAISEGMTTLCLDGIRKAAEGITSLRELRRVTSDLPEAR